MQDKLVITCPIHGEFYQKGNSHLYGKGCKECAKAKMGNSRSFFKGKRTILYVLELDEGIFKVGVTSRESIAKRYGGDTLKSYRVVLDVTFFNGTHAYNIEQMVIKNLKKYSFIGDRQLKRTKNHEVFTIDPTSNIIKIIKEKTYDK